MYDCKVKTFVPCIFLKDGRAVMGEESGKEVSQDPAHLAAVYADEMADAVLVVDCSEKEEEHEEMISCLRSICSSVQIPVLCAGNIRSLSDVKDIIYAGCGMAVLDFSKKDNVAIAKEAAEKLGKERIAAGCREPHEITENEDLIASSVSLLVLLEEKEQAACLAAAGIPCLGAVPDLEEETILSYFAEPNAASVTGKAVNAGMERIRSLRHLLLEHDYKVNARRPVFSWEELKKDPQGLVPVVVQEAYTDQVLMVAYMDENAYSKTIETGKMTYYSRSRRKEWVKGETSGHFQYVRSLTLDCDLDTILARVDQVGAACHTGHHSCFFNTDLVQNRLERRNPQRILESDYATILSRRAHPKQGSYTNYLFDHGLDRMLAELGRENAELIVAAKGKKKDGTVDEIADYLYHLMVVMAHEGITWKDVCEELAKRAKESDEKSTEE